jgi:hypothetical protein
MYQAKIQAVQCTLSHFFGTFAFITLYIRNAAVMTGKPSSLAQIDDCSQIMLPNVEFLTKSSFDFCFVAP